MSSEDANDVTKALAAFGAPSIRYHSFGQGQVRPSSVVMPRREPVPLATPIVPPVQTVMVTPPLLRQTEPVAAPEPRIVAVPLPPVSAPMPAAVVMAPPVMPPPVMAPSPSMPPPMPPVPAFRRTIDPAAVPARPTPMPPPRPLSDRLVAPSAPVSRPVPEAPREFVAPMAAYSRPAPALVPTMPDLPPVAERPVAPPAAPPIVSYSTPVNPPIASSQPRVHSLKEVFALLASAPGMAPA